MRTVWTAMSFLVLVTVGSPAADGPARGESARARISTLEAQISASKSVIRQTWKEIARLDRLVAQAAPPAAEPPAAGADEASAGVERAEAMLDQAFERESLESQRRLALQSLVNAYLELGYLEEEVRSAKSQMGRRPLLEGDWTLTVLPMGARGQVALGQKGTIVEGDYVMESGLTGNLQGTFISGQVVLERIDSTYGKMGRFEGQLTKDGGRIQGSWYSYDLQSGNPVSGSFTMDRIEAEP